jgi:hypothetical protein
MGRKPLHLMASVPRRWASPLNEGLGLTGGLGGWIATVSSALPVSQR